MAKRRKKRKARKTVCRMERRKGHRLLVCRDSKGRIRKARKTRRRRRKSR